MQSARDLLLSSFRKYGHLIALTILLSLLSAGTEIFSIGMLIPFLQNLSAEGETFRTGVVWIDQHVLAVDASEVERMYRIFGIILVAAWARCMFGYLSNLMGVTVKARVTEDMRMRVIDQLQAVALRFFSTTRTGEIINSAKSEITRVSGMIRVMKSTLEQGLLLLAYLAFMAWVSWQLTVLIVALLAVLALGLTRLIRSVRVQGERLTQANGRFTAVLTEFIGGIRTVVAFNMQERERDRLQETIHEKANALIETTRRNAAVQPISQAVVSTILIVVVALAVQFFVLPGALEMPFLLAFLFALFRAMPSIHQLNQQRGAWAQEQGALENVAALLRRDDKPYLKEGRQKAPALKKGITFENVDFSYEPGQPVLEDINAYLPCGQMTALVGATGAGKSTLADLIPRFFDPTEGRVLYDGTDLRDFQVRSLRDHIAVVSQDTHIFNSSVRDNIAYGTLQASFEQVLDAAKQANALGFIEQMPDGFDTVLGERGVKISGGQRQRLAIARALLRDPDILILDEATSALDSVTEELVQESLAQLMKGRTVIAVAHRLSTIEDADQVLVMEEGRIVEQGGYQELLEQRGQLWEYHSTQYQYEVA